MDWVQSLPPGRETTQQRSAKQRLEFFSPPEKPTFLQKSALGDVAAVNTLSRPHSDAVMASQGDSQESFQQSAQTAGTEIHGTTIKLSKVSTDAQPAPDSLQQAPAGCTETTAAHEGAANTVHGVGLPEARPPAAEGPLREQPSLHVPPVEEAILPAEEPARLDQPSRAPLAWPAEVAEVTAVPTEAGRDPAPEAPGVPNSSVTADSHSSTPPAQSMSHSLPGDHSQSGLEPPAIPAATGEVADAQSEGAHRGDTVTEEEGASFPGAVQGALSADAEPSEACSAIQHAPDMAASHGYRGESETQCAQTGQQSAGGDPLPEPQCSLSQPSEGAAGPIIERGAGKAEEFGSDRQRPDSLPEEQTAGSGSVGREQALGAALVPVDAEQQRPPALPDEGQAAPGAAETDEEPDVDSLPSAAESALEVAPEVHAAAQASSQTDRVTVTAMLPSLPLPPRVPPFQTQSFLRPSKAPITAPHAPAEFSLAAVPAEEAATSPDAEKHLFTHEAVSEGPVESEAADSSEAAAPDSAATEADLLALAEEVERLEQELERAQDSAKSAARQADAARRDAESARAEAAEWREREADARAEVRPLLMFSI